MKTFFQIVGFPLRLAGVICVLIFMLILGCFTPRIANKRELVELLAFAWTYFCLKGVHPLVDNQLRTPNL